MVVIGDLCSACGLTFLRMCQETYNYYVFTLRILFFLIFDYKTPLAPLNQRTAVMSALVQVLRRPDEAVLQGILDALKLQP